MGEQDELEALVQGLRFIGDALGTDALEPDPSRTPGDATELERALGVAESQVLSHVDTALGPLSDADRQRVKDSTARLLSGLAAAMVPYRREAAAKDLLSRAEALTTDRELGKMLAAGRRNLKDHALLAHAGWLARKGQVGRGQQVLRALVKEAQDPLHRELAQRFLSAPQPVTSAPPLFRINGFGVGLYGSRDKEADGSYVSTLCISALWIPVFPLKAYRVVSQGGRYGFVGSVPLSGFARATQAAFGLGALALVAAGAVGSWLDSPDRLAHQAFEAAAEKARKGDTGGAVAGYEQALDEYGGRASESLLGDGTLQWVKLRTGLVKTPITAEVEPELERVLLRFQEIPDRARAGEPATLLGKWMLARADELAQPSQEQAKGSLLEHLAAVAAPAEAAEAKHRLVTLRLAQAEHLFEKWPMHALEACAGLLDEPRAVDKVSQVLKAVGEAPALYLDAAPAISAWLRVAALDKANAEQVALVKGRLDAAQALDGQAGRPELLNSRDEKALAAALAQAPNDQAVAVSLAIEQRGRGDLSGAAATLDRFGGPGLLCADGLLLRALIDEELGKRESADAMLSEYLDRWLTRFNSAREQLDRDGEAAMKRIVDAAKQGSLPMSVETKLQQAEGDDEKQRQIFREYLDQTLGADQHLASLREEYQRYNGVVVAALHLGTARLMEANEKNGAERQALLGEAERIFLSVKQEAEGKPEFHLGMGRVYHQLGKAKEGDQELEALLKEPDQGLHLKVATVYRELGLVKKAREIAEAVFRTATEDETRDNAALFVGVLADVPSDSVSWLEKVKSRPPVVEAHLQHARGESHLHDGKLAEADKDFAAEGAIWEKLAPGNSSAANNAGTAAQGRYQATGDPAMLERAVKFAELSVKLDPENAIGVRNALATLNDRASIGLLEKRVHVKALRLDGHEARTLLGVLRAGPMKAELTADAKASPWFRRALELARRLEVLAPKNPDGWDFEGDWWAMLEDRAALASVKTRLERAGAVEEALSDEAMARYRTGQEDPMLKGMMQQRLDALKAIDDPHPQTRAAVKFLVSLDHFTLAKLDGDVAVLRQSIDEAKQAAEQWPALDWRSTVSVRLLLAAFLEARDAAPELGEAWKKDGRLTSVPVMLDREPKAHAAVRARPAFGEALELTKGLPDDLLGVTSWEIASIAGDEELKAKASHAMVAGPDAELSELQALVSPREAAEAALMRKATGK